MPPHLENVRFCQHVFVCFLHFGHLFKNKCIFLHPLGSLLALWAPLGQLWRPIGETKALQAEMSIHTCPFWDPFWDHLFSHSSIFSEKNRVPRTVPQARPFFIEFWAHSNHPQSLLFELSPASTLPARVRLFSSLWAYF